MSLPNQSPTRDNSSYNIRDGGRWTVDDSESRFLKSSINSPRKSILKGSRTPNTFFRPHFFHSQEQRQRLLQQVERRVSFAPDPSVRTFNENEASSSVNRDAVNPVQEPRFHQMFNDNIDHSSDQNQDNNRDSQQFTILSGSPIHRRKRTGDLLGSPVGNEKSPKLNFGQRVRLLGIDRFKRDEEGNDEDTLMRFLENSHQKGKRNIFEDMDDGVVAPQASSVGHTKRTLALNTPNDRSERGSLEEQNGRPTFVNSEHDSSQLSMSDTQTININYEAHITQESPPSLLDDSVIGRGDNDTQDALLARHFPSANSQRLEASYYDTTDSLMLQDINMLDNSDMELTQDNRLHNRVSNTPQNKIDEHTNPTPANQSPKHRQNETGGMQMTQDVQLSRQTENDNSRQEYTTDTQLSQVQHIEHNYDDNYRDHTVDMQLTQDIQTLPNTADINREDSVTMQPTQDVHPLNQALVNDHLEEAVDMQLTQETGLFKPDVPDDYYQEDVGVLPTQEVEPFKTGSIGINDRDEGVSTQQAQYSRPVTPVFPRTHQGTMVDRRLIEDTMQLSPILPIPHHDDMEDIDDMQITQEARQYTPLHSTHNQEADSIQPRDPNHSFDPRMSVNFQQDEYTDDDMQLTQDTAPIHIMRPKHNESFNYPEHNSTLEKGSTQEFGHSFDNTPERQASQTPGQTHNNRVFEDPVDQTVSMEITQPIHSPLRQSMGAHLNMGYTTPLALRELSSARHNVNYLSPFSSYRSRSAIHPQSQPGRSGFRSVISHRTSSFFHPEQGLHSNYSGFLSERSTGQQNRKPRDFNASWISQRQSLGNSGIYGAGADHDISTGLHNPPPTQMSLDSFLKHIGIKFEESIVNDERPPTTFSVEQAIPSTMVEQAAAAAVTLPQLETYKQASKKNRSKEAVENICRGKETESRQFSKEFFSSDANSRCEMINRLKLIKQFSLMKSKAIVDEQRADQIEKLNKELWSTAFEKNLEARLPEFYAYKYRVNDAFEKAKKREEAYNNIDHEAMKRLEVEIDEQRAAMQVFREQNEALESEEFQLRERSEVLQQRKIELLEALELAKRTRDENKCSTENDVTQAKERFKNNASKLRLSIIKKTEETTEVVISNDIRVTINVKLLKTNPLEAVSIRVEQNREPVYEEFTELLQGIDMLIKDENNQYKVLQKIIFYWHRVRAIRREIVFVGWRFESVLKPLSGESLAPDERGVRVEITVFSYISKVKFKLSLQFLSKDIFCYPALDLSKVDIDVNYGDVPVEKLRGLLAENGIVNLERTLCNFLSSLQNK
ncbi:hypothetical protein CLU79DRAFT_834925 [Phycomyces nitens]|nr:hypothetical protein CLU79DRAFT_834925 [Phycomyces nitens]